MKYAIKMTGPVQQVLRAMLADPAASRYGLEVSKLTGLETGTLYPVMARLETVGWVESSWEDPELGVREGRPRRRYYQLTRDGAEQARARPGGDLLDPGQAPRDPERRAAGRAGGVAVTGVLSGRAQPGPLQADPLAGLRGILQAIRPDADLRLIRRAYDVAAAWHDGQTRFSGDPYITHPLAVAAILAGLGASDQALCAALLHDTTASPPVPSPS